MSLEYNGLNYSKSILQFAIPQLSGLEVKIIDRERMLIENGSLQEIRAMDKTLPVKANVNIIGRYEPT